MAEVAAPEPALITVPPLDVSDSLVRELVGALSSHPRVAAWLATDDLICNFAAVVENISTGQAPMPHLQVWRPQRDFSVLEDDSSVIVDTRGYSHYADVSAAVDSINATNGAQRYATLKPRPRRAGLPAIVRCRARTCQRAAADDGDRRRGGTGAGRRALEVG